MSQFWERILDNRIFAPKAPPKVPLTPWQSLKLYINGFSVKTKWLSFVTLALSAYILYPSLIAQDHKMFSKRRPDKYTTGMINMTVDCFANSTVQSLASLPGLNVYLNEIQLQLSKLEALAEIDKLFAAEKIPSVHLHRGLVEIVGKLQEVVTSSRVCSVWDFLHILERIYNSKISRNQHDAHELLMLILETLERENLALQKFVTKEIKSDTVTIPDVPFRSLLLNQLKCLKCGGSSPFNYSPATILSLPTPQQDSVSLEELIRQSESENIAGYSCTQCKVRHVITTLSWMQSEGKTLSEEELRMYHTLKDLKDLKINDDLDADVQHYVDQFPGINEHRTTVNKMTNIISPPKILPIHLSRSIYQNTQATRNPCQVDFKEQMVLKINTKLMEEVERRKKSEPEQSSTPGTLEQDAISTNPPSLLLGEDKPETDFYEDVGQTSDAEEDNNEEDEEEEELEEDSASSSKSSAATASSTSPATEGGASASTTLPTTVTGASIEPAPAEEYKLFNYRLKAMIRHQGSHSLGHYECYRHKPVFYKNTDGTYSTDMPALWDERTVRAVGIINAHNEATQTEEEAVATNSSDDQTPRKRESFTLPQSIPEGTVAESKPLSRSGSVSSRFRSRVSSLVGGRRPSVVEDDAPDEYAQPQRRKKLTSSRRLPFWRISDTKVAEVTTEDVLSDSKAVYMLFYELVE